MDRLTRSWNMSRIKGKNTKPELAVRSQLHRLGYRYRLHSKNLPGKPDIVLPKYRTVIFVHGCYWHRHARCRFAYEPKSRKAFWVSKFKRNIERHREVTKQLRSLGWRVVVIWECRIRDPKRLKVTLKSFSSQLVGFRVNARRPLLRQQSNSRGRSANRRLPDVSDSID